LVDTAVVVVHLADPFVEETHGPVLLQPGEAHGFRIARSMRHPQTRVLVPRGAHGSVEVQAHSLAKGDIALRLDALCVGWAGENVDRLAEVVRIVHR
jgi:hypothetical protein